MSKSHRRPPLSILLAAAIFIIATCIPSYAENDRSSLTLGLPQPGKAKPDSQHDVTVSLGRKLFFDKRLSGDGTISCSSCHQPEKAFSDGRALTEGIHGRQSTRNAPSLLNAIFNSSQFWDGRRQLLEDQALDPIINPNEHGLPGYPELLGIVRGDQEYKDLFSAAFGVREQQIHKKHVAKAIAEFERTLLSGNSRFDQYTYGRHRSALSPQEINGLELFKGRAGCGECHVIGTTSALLTDNAFHSRNIGFQKIGPRLGTLTKRLVEARSSATALDDTILGQEDLAELGRFAVTLDPKDIGKFRTPSLRNVALTAPYMHDGSVPTLAAAIEFESYRHGSASERPLILAPQEKQDILAFLKSLNGDNRLLGKLSDAASAP